MEISTFLGSKWFVMAALILAIWLFGGMEIIFKNPALIIFGLLIFVIILMKDKK